MEQGPCWPFDVSPALSNPGLKSGLIDGSTYDQVPLKANEHFVCGFSIFMIQVLDLQYSAALKKMKII